MRKNPLGKAIFLLISPLFCGLLLSFAPAFSWAGLSAPEIPHEINIEALDEEGAGVLVDWRRSAAWVWNQNSLALQLWLEIPSSLVSGMISTPVAEVVLDNPLAPFEVSEGHSLLLIHLKGPNQMISLQTESKDHRLGALRVHIPYEKTIWLRHPSCHDLIPVLIERRRTAEGPFFLALTCRNENSKNPAVVVRVEASDDGIVSVKPTGAAKLAGPQEVLLSLDRMKNFRSLGLVEVTTPQGDSVARYELTHYEGGAATEVASEEVEKSTTGRSWGPAKNSEAIGLHLQALQKDSPQPSFNLSWDHKWTEVDRNLHIEGELPLMQFGVNGNRGPLSTSLGWLRALEEFPTGNESLHWEIGVQASRFNTLQRTRPEISGVSPAAGLLFHRGSALAGRWELLVAPYEPKNHFGLASLRGIFPLKVSEPLKVNLTVEGFTGRTINIARTGDFYTSGYNLGLSGEF